jgi:putative hydrolase of the HAD superfamily
MGERPRFDPVTLRAVLFDLDDTLYPEQAYVLSGFRAAAQHGAAVLGLDAAALERACVRLFTAGRRSDIFDAALRLLGRPVTPQAVAFLVEAYRTHVPQLHLPEETAMVLRALRPRYRLGVITDGYAAVQRRKVAALGLEPLVDVIVYTDDWGRAAWKPAPDGFVAALEQLGIAPPQALYVGDNPAKDFIGARALGLQTIRLCVAGREHAAVRLDAAREADIEITRLARLLDLLGCAE